MNQYKAIFLVFFLSLAFLKPSFAADQQQNSGEAFNEFAEQMNTKFFGFECIEYPVLHKMIDKVPGQKLPWTCGIHQAGHIFCCAESSHNINYNEPEDYPLSVDVNVANLASMLASLNLKTDEQGNLRVGPTPIDMAGYLNKHLPKSFALGAVAKSTANLTKEELIAIVKNNMEHKMPTLVYAKVGNFNMHFYAIVGLSDQNGVDELMVLNTTGQGVNRLMVFSATDFVDRMDAGSIAQTVKKLDTRFGFLIRSIISFLPNSRLATSDTIQPWQAFSLITFVNKDQMPENKQ